jgi:hypothetical protein
VCGPQTQRWRPEQRDRSSSSSSSSSRGERAQLWRRRRKKDTNPDPQPSPPITQTQTKKHSVGKQVVNIPSFMVRVDSQKHVDFSLTSPFGGGRPGRVKRKSAAKGSGGDGGEDDE